jgi:membrane fusion protein (multidrug efflux system)
VISLFTLSCKEKDKTKETVVKTFVEELTKVKVAKVRKGTFYKEILNNGKLSASRKAELLFEQSGEVLSVEVRNGQRVKKGQLLAKVDDTTQKYELEKAQMDLDKAMLEMEDYLIGAGYSMRDTTEIPKNIHNIGNIRSGYRTAQANYERATQNYQETKITAPFSGIVTNLEAKAFNASTKYAILCDLVDNSAFEVSFSILETEYQQIKKGLPVEVTVSAFANDTFPGLISCVNPSVDDNGMIKALAYIPNKNSKLIEGMNAQVIVKIAVPHQIIIPKSAVVLRQERKVVFTNPNDSTAHWNYVSIINENRSEVAIESNIGPDEEVIVEGNLELGHLTPIVVK